MRFFIVTTESFPELHFYEPRGQGVESLLACQSNKNRSVKERFFYALQFSVRCRSDSDFAARNP